MATISGSGYIQGTSVADIIYGDVTNDTIFGGVGADTMYGGKGDDIYSVDNIKDKVVENAGEGNDLVVSTVTYTLGANIEGLLLSGNAAINGTGNELDNLIGGNATNNTLNGGLGADTMSGAAGNDTYIVDNVNDKVIENYGEGTDIVSSSVSYTLSANVENLTLTGTAASGTGNELDNIILGNASVNTLSGGAGNDTLDGGVGADTMYGGTGDDTYKVDNAGDVVSENSNEGIDTVISTVSYSLGANVENLTLSGTALSGTGNDLANILTGNASNNILNGGAGNDVLYGGAGNDTLDGGTGYDKLYGGTGNDTYYVENSLDTVYEDANGGIDTVVAYGNYVLGANVENLTLAGTSTLQGAGNELNNILIGNSTSNYLWGGAGNDTIDGGVGADIMNGDSGDDTYIVDNVGDQIIEGQNAGNDTVYSSVSYSIYSNIENLILTGSADLTATGGDLGCTLTGNLGNNFLTGGDGNDLLNGGVGADTMVGGKGNDTYYVDNVGDFVTENSNEGTDTVISTINYTLSANVENLTLVGTALSGTGNELDNKILGNASVNTLTGGAGNDTLDGGVGADSMYGGTGNDTYYIDNIGDKVFENSGEGTDTVISSVNYTLGANVENLILAGAAITGIGSDDNNTITGNASNNTLNGGLGADTMIGGAGNDTYYVDNVLDVVIDNAVSGTSTSAGNAGIDTVYSTVSYTLGTFLENLILTGTGDINATGNELANTLTGNAGNNVLIGGAGNDVLDGKAGNDSMYGGTGDDTYYVDNSADVIVEYSAEGTDLVYAASSYSLSANVENLTLTGTGAFNATGNDLANKIVGNAGNNIIDGGAGADTMTGGAGNDTYFVDNTGDVVVEAANGGTDTVVSKLTSYTLGLNVEKLTIDNSIINQDFTGKGNALANTIVSGNGNDTLDGGLGADTMTGGSGNDTYYVDNIGDVVNELANQGTDAVFSAITYTIKDNIENLTLTGTGNINGTGNAGDNYITGNAGNNILTGGAGNDTLDGGAGLDSLYGGTGNDTYMVDSTIDKIFENTGEGIDTVIAKCSYTLGANFENLTLVGAASINTATTLTGVAVSVFGESNAWSNYLDYYQGDNSSQYTGDCGLVACENVLIQSGVLAKKIGYTPGGDLLESQVVDLAKTNRYCFTGGGTTAQNQKAVLHSYGVEATPQDSTLEDLAQFIKDGKAVIVEINACKIWSFGSASQPNHAVDLTGVAYNQSNPSKIEGFYICDSGRMLKSDSERFVSYDLMKSAFYYSNGGYTQGQAVVTDSAVKQQLTTIDGTGNALDNVLTGSDGNNTLSGLAGNDTYVINKGGGRDTIVDTSGTNDVLSFGSGILKADMALYASGNDLILDFKNGNQVTIQNQLNGSDAIEKVQLNDNSYLSNTLINNLIQQMSSYASSHGIQITSGDTVRSNSYLSNLVATSWQTA